MRGTMPLFALTLPLHRQGRAGADGARGMPGEPGVKVTGMGPSLLPVTSSPISKLICFLGMAKFPRFPHEVAPPHLGHSREVWGGKKGWDLTWADPLLLG